MSIEKLKNTLVPSIFAGAVGTAAFYFIYDHELMAKIPFAGTELPVGLTVGLTVGLGNMAGEVLTQFVLPLIPKNEMFQNYEEHIVPPILAGLGSFAAMKILVSENTLFLPAMVVGASGSVGGKYLYSMI